MATETPIDRAQQRSHRRTWWYGAAALVVVLVVGTGWYWTFHPRELSSYRPLPRGLHTLMLVGRTQYATQIIGPDHNYFHDTTVDLQRVTPVIVENSARARVQVLSCVPTFPSEGVASLSDFCRSARVFQPGVINLGATQHILLLAITPTRPGSVDIAGLNVRYRDGIRRGSQHTGNEIAMTTD